VLQDFPGCRINYNHFVCQSGGHKQLAVGTQRQRQRPQAGKFDQHSGGCDELVDRRLETAGVAANNFSRCVEILQRSGRLRCRQCEGGQQAMDGNFQFHSRLK
jgi:hypothetical protein